MKPAMEPGNSGAVSVGGKWRRGVAILDFLLRLIAITVTLAAAIAMGTTDETLPFFTQFFQFEAKFNDFPAFTFFVIANAIVCGYLFLSLPMSIFNILRPHAAAAARMILIFFDTAMLALATAGASSAAAIVYLAHKGNALTNWFSICRQFDSFCERVSGALVGSFIGAVALILLVVLSASTLNKH